MRVKAATVQKVLLGSALLAALAWNLAQASEINGLALSAGATGTRAEIGLDREADFKVISLKGPDRLVVDLPTSSLAKGVKLPAPAGLIKAVRTGAPSEGTTRIVFDLAQPVAVLKPHLEPGATGPRLVLEWPGDGAEPAPPLAATPAPAPPVNAAAANPPATPDSAASSAATTRLITEIAARSAGTPVPGNNASANPPLSNAAAPSTNSATVASNPATVSPAPATAVPPPQPAIATGVPTRVATGQPAAPSPTASAAVPPPAGGEAVPGAVKTMKDVMRGRGMRPLVIAIDAGHGGQDSGAVGVKGNKEKDVTLAIARELARQVNATPGLKAYLTRDSDFYIPLNNRAKLARGAKADMFVSIHADAAENRSAKGSSVYVLSLKGASSQRARWLADKENASDMIGGVRLTKTSDTLASVLLDLTQSGHMKASEDAANHVLDGLKRVGNNHKPSIERANFAVLRTSDMPSMLVETAFISNPDEERRLTDPAYQRTLARAVLEGVNTYFTRQPPPGTLYAAKAEANYSASLGGAGGGAP
ncbi:N-acetylmuramoyl-L-alanine amidase [Lysobacter niastensis]|uniref:N-acetylmuramoyl-L-alanine amidase n=1 Tax=Lysobacter niastensis TaxID=380629 RepID=A0ABS0B9L3_9GAMM|nr:N-acetylmuramoyl-L-alanine amidase [Lysobacter niastensis]MBF6024349.1 N-acetylmuramoyl-L-alanine amidase [Lysobacter niastensis]